jgi:phospholipase B1
MYAFTLLVAALICFASSELAPEVINGINGIHKMMTEEEWKQHVAQHMALWEQANQAGNYQPGQTGYTCPGDLMKPSATVPTNVNQIRPADIKVIAALGDSLTAANGALATKVPDIVNQYRGVAFLIGGDQQLEETITLANILRKYNPALFGQSHGIGKADDFTVSQLNVAVPGSVINDLIPQATELVKRLQTHPQVNYTHDWKLINIFYGGNDMCAYCKNNTKFSAATMSAHLKTILTTLSTVPRAIVNIVGMFHLEMLRTVGTSDVTCQTMHLLECPCSQNPFFSNGDFAKIEVQYQAAQLAFQSSGAYERDDFTVIIQVAMEQTTQAPLDAKGKPDLAFFAPDCFHFSRKGHNVVSRMLWNNMLQPVGNKMLNYNLTDSYLPILCPDAKCPYIRTAMNSKNCTVTPTVGSGRLNKVPMAISHSNIIKRKTAISHSNIIQRKMAISHSNNVGGKTAQSATTSSSSVLIAVIGGCVACALVATVLSVLYLKRRRQQVLPHVDSVTYTVPK